MTAAPTVWPAAISWVHAHLGADYRVEAVDTQGHWPAVYLADAGIPLARGWFRQDDFPQNQVLYSKLGAAAYLGWLRGLGVKYVVLSDAPPDYSARAEAALVSGGRAGLEPVFSTQTLTVYAVPNPQPIVTGPGAGAARVAHRGAHGSRGHARPAATGSPCAGARTGSRRRAASARARTG